MLTWHGRISTTSQPKRQYYIDTKSLSNALVNYSNDIFSTVKVIEEKNFKREDLIGNIKSDTKQELLSTVEIKNTLKKVRNYADVTGVTFTEVSAVALCIYTIYTSLISEKIRI
ncbi:hypothetical protein Glove_423g38 [Diversispora epigaea]|uniref:Uncharacterized protein n=1 Tax=Diversispora epigaea TaxID=1348612 RepID=A0A397GUU5_9GLOM|nr:hypothetical protein Glove_423g38 [Diversispora epigaea]